MNGTLSETNIGLHVEELEQGFQVSLDGRVILRHTSGNPCLFIGRGEEKMDMYRGNFDIEDYVEERFGLRYSNVSQAEQGYRIEMKRSAQDEEALHLSFEVEKGKLVLHFSNELNHYNRFWLRLHAEDSEYVYGCGEQMSHLNLRGKHFPLWTSEPGVGRNKRTYTTWQADVHDKAGGDYYHTNYPLPTFISSRGYYCHVNTSAYADFDFRKSSFHELHIWEIPTSIQIETGETYKEIVSKLTSQFGRQHALPEWTYDGIWLGLQGGTETVQKKIDAARDSGIKVGAVWVQDWQGKRVTSFGRRLNWNWKWDPKEYPGLDEKIKEWKREGIRFLGYINPYVVVDDSLYNEAKEKNLLVLNQEDETYLVDFGEFDCGIVDLTNDKAFSWYKDVIKTNLIDFGLDGWMADFGEYLPIDAKLHNGISAKVMHNAWPALWARVNYEAVKDAGKLDDIIYFMRAGYTGSQQYARLLWAGDQSVDWSLDDGIASVIPAALSAGMTGNGLHHSDIGGYTSLHGNKRTKELLLRWLEMATFTPVMRSHEGNRPTDSYQYDHDEETMKRFADMTDIHCTLAPYLRELVEENAQTGVPVQRPLFMEYETDVHALNIQYEYMLGSDLLVAPVYEQGRTTWDVYLPEDEWIHLWSGQEFSGGSVTVDAPIGEPPVFYRKQSKHKQLFESINNRP